MQDTIMFIVMLVLYLGGILLLYIANKYEKCEDLRIPIFIAFVPFLGTAVAYIISIIMFCKYREDSNQDFERNWRLI